MIFTQSWRIVDRIPDLIRISPQKVLIGAIDNSGCFLGHQSSLILIVDFMVTSSPLTEGHRWCFMSCESSSRVSVLWCMKLDTWSSLSHQSASCAKCIIYHLAIRTSPFLGISIGSKVHSVALRWVLPVSFLLFYPFDSYKFLSILFPSVAYGVTAWHMLTTTSTEHMTYAKRL